MPFKSQAQRRYFHAMVSRGEIAPKTLHTWEEHTPKGPLPERVHPKDYYREKKKKAFITKEAFWSGFFKKADSGPGGGGKGFSSSGKDISRYPIGELQFPQHTSTEEGYGRAEEEDTRTEKGLRDQERGPITYNYRESGDVVHNGEVPQIMY